MLSSDVASLSDRLFAGDKRNRARHLADRVRDITSDATTRGQTGAARFHALIVDAYAQEFRARADLLWDVLQRVLSAEGMIPSGQLASDIKEYLTPRLVSECTELAKAAGEQIGRFSARGSMQTRVADELRPIEEGLFARVDLFTKQLRGAESQQPSAGPVQNFYASTGSVVQTGAGSTATVNQSVVLGDTRSTLDALETLSRALESVTNAAGYSQRELLDLVTDLAQEIRKPQPNRLKVSQLAAGLGLALQSVASIKPAYELVRTAFLGWGIHLPILP